MSAVGRAVGRTDHAVARHLSKNGLAKGSALECAYGLPPGVGAMQARAVRALLNGPLSGAELKPAAGVPVTNRGTVKRLRRGRPDGDHTSRPRAVPVSHLRPHPPRPGHTGRRRQGGRRGCRITTPRTKGGRPVCPPLPSPDEAAAKAALLREAMFGAIRVDHVRAMMEKAAAGDHRAMKFIADLIREPAAGPVQQTAVVIHRGTCDDETLTCVKFSFMQVPIVMFSIPDDR